MLSHGRITGCHHHLSLHIQWSRHHHHVMDSIKKLMISQRCFFLAQIKVGESHFDIQKEAAVLVKHRKVKLGLCFYVASLNVVFFISLFVCGVFFLCFQPWRRDCSALLFYLLWHQDLLMDSNQCGVFQSWKPCR